MLYEWRLKKVNGAVGLLGTPEGWKSSYIVDTVVLDEQRVMMTARLYIFVMLHFK